MSSPDEIKVMYLAPLPSQRGHTAFRERWRAHGELAMGLSFWRHMTRYKQCDVLTAAELGLGAEQAAMYRLDEFGGLGIIYFRDAAALEAAVESDDGATMVEDERHAFGRELGANLVPTVEHVVINGEPGAVTLFGAVHRREGLDRRTFSESWRELGAALVRHPEVAGMVTRYVQNHALETPEYCDGFVELSFAAAQDVAPFTAALVRSGLMAKEREFLDHSRLEVVLTAENVLYDQAADIGPRSTQFIAG
jgi:hypothetical protein